MGAVAAVSAGAVDARQSADAADRAATLERDSDIRNAGRATVIVIAAVAILSLRAETVTAAAAVTGFVASVFWLRAPQVALLGLGVLCTIDVPMRIYFFGDLGLRYNTFNYALLAVGMALLPAAIAVRQIQVKWLAAFAAVLLLQLFYSAALDFGLHAVLEVLAGLALALCFLRAGLSVTLVRWMAIVNAVVAAAFMLAYFAGAEPGEPINGNALSQVTVAGIASLALAASVPGAVRSWPMTAALLAVNIVCVVTTSSRGGQTICAILTIYLIARTPGKSFKAFFAAASAAALLATSALFMTQYDASIDKWSWLVDPERTMSAASNRRSDLAQLGLEIFRDNPAGIGTGSFAERSRPKNPQLDIDVQAHSAWVKVMAENGIPGLVLLGGYVLSFWWSGRRRIFPGARALSLLVVVTVTVSFLFVEFQSKGIWLLAAVAGALLARGPGTFAAAATPLGGRPRALRPSVLPRPTAEEAEHVCLGELDDVTGEEFLDLSDVEDPKGTA